MQLSAERPGMSLLPLISPFIVLLILTLVGCATKASRQSALPKTPTSVFQTGQDIIQPESLLTLTAEQRAEFMSFFESETQAEYAPRERVFNYLARDIGQFRFDGANLPATTALATKTGNCVSLALVVAALAKEVDIEVAYRASYSEPMLGFRDDLALSSNHVQSYVLAPKKNANSTYSQRDAVIIDYLSDPLDRVGEMFDGQHFLAVVYNNLAADALLAKDPSKAYWLSMKALELDPNYSPSVNLIAVIYRQQGDLASARQWFEHGLKQPKNSVLIVGNYLRLAEQTKDVALQKRLQALMEVADDDNPYAWYYLAEQFRKKREFTQAAKFYQKLVNVAPYLHHVNLQLAKLYVELGQERKAVDVLKQGETYAYDASSRERYEKKLIMVKQLLSSEPRQ